MNAFEEMRLRFSNQRKWHEFVTAVQCSVSYPNVLNTLRSGTQWFNAGVAQASACATPLRISSSK
jgi:hypothetical protein